MANEGELKTMIKCFRIHELQLLLGFAGRSKAGRKQELQDRALGLLQLNSQPLYFKIKHLFDTMQKGYKSDASTLTSPELNNSPVSTTERDDGGGLEEKDDSISIVDEGDIQRKGSLNINLRSKEDFQRYIQIQSKSTLQLTVNPLYYPVHPDVRFKKLPFYKVLYELVKPSSLVPQNYNIQQENSFMFYLTPQQAAAISLSKDSMPGIQDDFTVQGQLRFCLLETTSKQYDCYPSGLIVRINNKFCNIQDSFPKKKKDIYVRDISPPINITPFMKISPAVGNKIDVQWNAEYGRAYVVAVYLVQKKTSEDLLNRLKAKAIRCADHTTGMIKDKLNEEADSEIVTTSLRVSLMCPLGKMRLKTPSRSSTCQHLQCFDASLFIQMNERKPTWICPVCDNPAEYDKLVIDGYFQDILSSDKLLNGVNEIELHSDGTWSPMTPKVEDGSNSDGNTTVKVETEEVVDVIVEETKFSLVPKKENEVLETANVSGDGGLQKSDSAIPEKRRVEEIDLTISDSDDEPLIWYKRRESSKNKRNCILHSNSNSNRSSPSLINLDSDSSDSLQLVMSNSVPTSVMTDFNNDGNGDLQEVVTAPKTNENVLPWFPESTVFF